MGINRNVGVFESLLSAQVSVDVPYIIGPIHVWPVAMVIIETHH